jgi:U4/U6.U5 tri-snRNP component SNU23
LWRNTRDLATLAFLNIMADKAGAYGTKAADTDFRKKWDKEEYAAKAKKKDDDERERMQENQQRMQQGEDI